jgi:hypothetical protein
MTKKRKKVGRIKGNFFQGIHHLTGWNGGPNGNNKVCVYGYDGLALG